MVYERLLKDLVRIKSLSGEEDEIINFISGWFDERGIEAHLQGENLFVHLEGRDRTRAFIFNSHMDTVDKGDREWRYGPWTPTKVENKLIGLGTSDMKSGLAASMLLAELVAKSGVPSFDMWFTYVVKEEVDGSGTKSFAEWFKKGGYVSKYKDIAGIFTEPTGLVEIEHGHRGNIFVRAESSGDSGHASRPHLMKKHAVREMIKFSDALQNAMSEWKKEFASGIFEPPTVGEMTSIQAGVGVKGEEVVVKSPNKFPSVCVATFDIRTTPEFHEVAFTRIQKLAKKMGVKISYAFPPAPAGYTDPSEKIIKVAERVLKEATFTVSQGSADLGFLSANGVKSIILGPGEKEQAHKTDEYCYPAQIPQALEIYKAIVEAWAR